MFSQSEIQSAGVQASKSSLGTRISQQPYGVTSAINELCSEVNQITSAVSELRAALGISCPEEPNKINYSTDALVGALRYVIEVLRNTNGDLTECVGHLRN